MSSHPRRRWSGSPAKSIVDRLISVSNVIETGTTSYHLAQRTN
ncbi:hypothetical protein [Microlunatus aurantiacus]